jgi:hypothetical protein
MVVKCLDTVSNLNGVSAGFVKRVNSTNTLFVSRSIYLDVLMCY